MGPVHVRSDRASARGLLWGWVLLLVLGTASWCAAGAFLFADEDDAESITHPHGYRGRGGPLRLEVCIDARSANAEAMVIPVENAVKTWNQLRPTVQNIDLDRSNGLASNQVDFESVVLHELGHCLGLGHPNAATESGLAGRAQNYTRTTAGRNDVFDVDPGPDGIIGSGDDRRGDDVNLHWFRVANNNPFTMDTVVDTTTYSQDTADLPPGHTFAANGASEVGALLGFPHTEAVMQQGAFLGEAQRQLSHDDVATLRLGMSGVDELAGTADDYTVTLVARGLVDRPGRASGCEIIVDFDDDETGFAVCKVRGKSINADHVRVTSARMFFHDGFRWFFNQEPVQVAEADLAIAQAVAPAAKDPGQVSYTLTVTNHGPTSATQVMVTDHVPSGAEIIDVAFARGACTDGEAVITCAIETLSPDETVERTIVVRPTAKTAETSTASVISNELDPDLSNNTAVLGITAPGEVAKDSDDGDGGGGCTLRPGAAPAFPLVESVLCLALLLGWKLGPRRGGTSRSGIGDMIGR